MPLKYFHCPGKPWAFKTLDDCLACDHQCVGGEEWLRVLWNENINDDHPYHNDPDVVSVTETLGCLRKAAYNRAMDYAEEPQALMARTVGSAVHNLIEKHNSDGHSEVGIAYQLPSGKMLRGTMDRELPTKIRDWKTVDRCGKTMGGGTFMRDGVKLHLNAMQLSIYADICEALGNKPVEELEIVQVSRKEVKPHECYRVDGALEWAVERAERLLSDKPEDMGKEGPEVKFYSKCACDFCVHRAECKPEVE